MMLRFPTVARTLLVSSILGSVLLLSSGCGEASGLSLPDMRFRDLEGETLSLSELEGKAVLLNFWFLG